VKKRPIAPLWFDREKTGVHDINEVPPDARIDKYVK